MLEQKFGFLLFLFFLCLIYPIYIFYIYKKYHSIINIKTLSFLLVYLSSMLIIVTSVFPIPFQKDFIKYGIPDYKNIYNPLERISQLYIYWISQKYPLYQFIIYNLYYWISNTWIFIIIGFTFRTLFNIKKSTIGIVLCSFVIQLIPLLIGLLIIHKNYKPIDTERSILLLVGGLLGFVIYSLLKKVIYKYHDQSTILDNIYYIVNTRFMAKYKIK